MNEVYVLISGCYSDWHIEGFVESEEEAIKTCIAFNEELKKKYGNSYSYDDCEIYYMKASKFNEVSPEKIKGMNLLYNHRVRVWKHNGSWEFQNEENIDVSDVKENRPRIEFSKDWDPDRSDYAVIDLALTVIDRKKALKIAQDMLYQKLAEKEEL